LAYLAAVRPVRLGLFREGREVELAVEGVLISIPINEKLAERIPCEISIVVEIGIGVPESLDLVLANVKVQAIKNDLT